MKITAKYILLATAVASLGLASCNKFLDVQPKGTLTEDAQFSNYEGYIDALYGVTGTMAGNGLYGRELSYGFIDKLGQLFRNTNEGSTSVDDRILSFDYTSTQVRPTVDGLWQNLYRTISYANNILRNAADPQFSDTRLNRIQAEAYGLRALMHLDVYRLFGPMNYEAHKGDRDLPYSTTFNLENKPVYTNEEFLGQILADLQRAEALMGEDETIELNIPTETEITRNRVVHLNRYALYALFARVYNLQGNSARAQEYADRVIGKFRLATQSGFNAVKAFPARGEMVFGLYAPRFAQDAFAIFSGSQFFGRADLDQTIYATSSAVTGNRDIRYTAYYKNEGFIGTPERNRFIRFGQSASEIDRLLTTSRGLAMIRLPEMYYIRAEALYRQGDAQGALAALNTVRSARGLQALDAAQVTSLDDLKRQLQLEYIKEYPGEGQVFFALKHLGVSFTNYAGATVTPTETLFKLPRPENEQRYGNQ